MSNSSFRDLTKSYINEKKLLGYSPRQVAAAIMLSTKHRGGGFSASDWYNIPMWYEFVFNTDSFSNEDWKTPSIAKKVKSFQEKARGEHEKLQNVIFQNTMRLLTKEAGTASRRIRF